jgi:hypothetical protein
MKEERLNTAKLEINLVIHGVQMKGIQNKKCISRKLLYTYLVYVIGMEN